MSVRLQPLRRVAGGVRSTSGAGSPLVWR